MKKLITITVNKDNIERIVTIADSYLTLNVESIEIYKEGKNRIEPIRKAIDFARINLGEVLDRALSDNDEVK